MAMTITISSGNKRVTHALAASGASIETIQIDPKFKFMKETRLTFPEGTRFLNAGKLLGYETHFYLLPDDTFIEVKADGSGLHILNETEPEYAWKKRIEQI